MKRNPIVEEVRKARSALVQRYGGDVNALCDALAARRDAGVRYVAFGQVDAIGTEALESVQPSRDASPAGELRKQRPPTPGRLVHRVRASSFYPIGLTDCKRSP